MYNWQYITDGYKPSITIVANERITDLDFSINSLINNNMKVLLLISFSMKPI